MTDTPKMEFLNDNKDIKVTIEPGQGVTLNNQTPRDFTVSITSESGLSISFTSIPGSSYKANAGDETLVLTTQSGDEPPEIRSV